MFKFSSLRIFGKCYQMFILVCTDFFYKKEPLNQLLEFKFFSVNDKWIKKISRIIKTTCLFKNKTLKVSFVKSSQPKM